jgi:hypothetical protein
VVAARVVPGTQVSDSFLLTLDSLWEYTLTGGLLSQAGMSGTKEVEVNHKVYPRG